MNVTPTEVAGDCLVVELVGSRAATRGSTPPPPEGKKRRKEKKKRQRIGERKQKEVKKTLNF